MLTQLKFGSGYMFRETYGRKYILIRELLAANTYGEYYLCTSKYHTTSEKKAPLHTTS